MDLSQLTNLERLTLFTDILVDVSYFDTSAITPKITTSIYSANQDPAVVKINIPRISLPQLTTDRPVLCAGLTPNCTKASDIEIPIESYIGVDEVYSRCNAEEFLTSEKIRTAMTAKISRAITEKYDRDLFEYYSLTASIQFPVTETIDSSTIQDHIIKGARFLDEQNVQAGGRW